MINIIVIYIDGIVPKKSQIRTSRFWTFKEKKYKPRLDGIKDDYIVSCHLDVYDDSAVHSDRFYYQKGKEALKELYRINAEEQNDIKFTYHYSYFYDNQCNIEFDTEFVKLLGVLNCNITITCAQDEIEDQEA